MLNLLQVSAIYLYNNIITFLIFQMQIVQSLLKALEEYHHVLERWFGGHGLAA